MDQMTSFTSMVSLVELVLVTGQRGTPGALRDVHQYFAKDGRLLVEYDNVGVAPDAMGREILSLEAEVQRLKSELAAAKAGPDQEAANV